jgi:hypothetical protein
MDTALEKWQRKDESDIFIGRQAVKSESDSLIFANVESRVGGSVEVKLFGEGLKRLLKSHTFHFREKRNDDKKVRRFRI